MTTFSVNFLGTHSFTFLSLSLPPSSCFKLCQLNLGVHSFYLANQILPRSPWASHLTAVKTILLSAAVNCHFGMKFRRPSSTPVTSNSLHMWLTELLPPSSSSPALHHIRPDLRPFLHFKPVILNSWQLIHTEIPVVWLDYIPKNYFFFYKPNCKCKAPVGISYMEFRWEYLVYHNLYHLKGTRVSLKAHRLHQNVKL